MAINYTPVLETATTLPSPHSSRSWFGGAGAQLPPPPGPSGRAPPAEGAAAPDIFAPTVAPRRLSEARPRRRCGTAVHGARQLFKTQTFRLVQKPILIVSGSLAAGCWQVSMLQ